MIKFFPVFLLLLIGIIVEGNIIFSGDVSYLIHAATQLFAGGDYVTDIWETNPPMILYLYWPVCFLTQLTGASPLLAVKTYIFLLATLSLFLNYYLLKKILPDRQGLVLSLLYTLAFIFFVYPLHAFAQREHLFLIVFFPYLLVAAARIKQITITSRLALMIGFFAALGFALKPFFLIPLCLIEIYLIFKSQRFFAWLRPESLMVIFILLLYLMSVVFLQPNYIHIILPYIFRYYYTGVVQPLGTILTMPNVLFSLAVLIGYFVFMKNDKEKIVANLLALALIGCLLAFMVPRQGWAYHRYPAEGLSFILLIFIAGQAFQFNTNTGIKDISFSLCTLGLILLMPMYVFYLSYLKVAEMKTSFQVETKKLLQSSPMAQHSVFCFSVTTVDCFPLAYETQSRYATRFPLFWWFFGIRKKENAAIQNNLQLEHDKNFLINQVAFDLNRYQSHWIIVNDKLFNTFEVKHLDIIEYFLQNKQFAAAFKNYHYVKSIDHYRIFERT